MISVWGELGKVYFGPLCILIMLNIDLLILYGSTPVNLILRIKISDAIVLRVLLKKEHQHGLSCVIFFCMNQYPILWTWAKSRVYLPIMIEYEVRSCNCVAIHELWGVPSTINTKYLYIIYNYTRKFLGNMK